MDSTMRKQPRCKAVQSLPSCDKVTIQFVLHRSGLQSNVVNNVVNNQAICVFVSATPATLGSSKKVWVWLRMQRHSQHAKALCSNGIALHK